MLAFFRIIKFSCQDIVRNVGMSAMTVVILILMLLSVNVLYSVDVLTKEAINLVKDQVNVSIYFNPKAQDKDVEQIKKYIDSFAEVTNLQLITRDEVLNSFKERHALSKDVLDALKELDGNPFGPTIVVKTKEPGDYKKVIQALSVPEYQNLIEAKSFDAHESAIEKIQTITSRLEKIAVGLSALFAIISFLIIFNTVRVAIHTQHVEISIKRLVGADNWFIRGPYIVESFIFTFISIFITIALVYLSLRWLDPYLGTMFSNSFSLTKQYNSNILTVFGIQALSVLLLTIISSGLAMRKQLKV